MHGYGIESAAIELRGLFNTVFGGRLDLAHLKFRDWLNHEAQYTWSEPVTIREISGTANK